MWLCRLYRHRNLIQVCYWRPLLEPHGTPLPTPTFRIEFGYITPVLAQLHWLPVKFRIDFKILLFVFKALNGLAPPYSAEMLSAYSTPRSTRSSTKQLLSVPRTRLKTKADRAFSIAGPNLWNPFHLISSPLPPSPVLSLI